jgi:anaerobic selenocysteine-containing dehydrogenase
LGPLVPALPDRLPDRDGRIDLAPADVIADLERLRRSLDETPPSLQLIGRREPRSVNSWCHNLPTLMRGRRGCFLLVHPGDADTAGISDGDRARLSSRVGSIEVTVQITETMMPGVVCLPHGHGHGQAGTRLKVAAEHAGVSMNDLTDPAEIDPLSGNAVLSGVPVSIEPLAR